MTHPLDTFLTELQARQKRCKAATGMGWQRFWAYAEEQTGINRKSWRMLTYPDQWYRPTKAGRWNPSIHHLKELDAALAQMEAAQATVSAWGTDESLQGRHTEHRKGTP